MHTQYIVNSLHHQIGIVPEACARFFRDQPNRTVCGIHRSKLTQKDLDNKKFG